ncbi:S49 family peptidase [Desulfoluna spongiiphila]|uniref:Serine protease, ClpP class n=1 Tax=Desulfoluna spongiiphila TaxID=419481 RepID=A0A1G5G0X7_9BACT|nr:S49 family peptidase [Desulfoluna spongiiphila]SCY44820.1 serine protease, ClpP class [Desulfoluna spongiiphila]
MRINVLDRPWLMSEGALRSVVEIIPTPEMLATKRAQRLERTWTATLRGNVAIVAISGTIARYDSFYNYITGGTATEDLAVDIPAADQNPDVKAIILDVGSHGGEATGINEMAEIIRNLKTPVVAYVGGMAASAAYWLASAADEIVVDATAELGSIGAVFGYRKGKEQTIEIVSTVSPKKRLDPESKEGREEILTRADALADIFISQVAKYRGVTAEKVKKDFGQGGMLIAQAAIDAGMADRIGSLEGLIAELQAKHKSTHGGSMGLREELQALVAGKDETEIKTALAAMGYLPAAEKGVGEVDVAKIKEDATAAGVEQGKAEALENTKLVMEKCQLAGVTSAKFTAEMLALTPEEAGAKILDAQADGANAAEIFSTVNPMSDGGENPLVADAKKRAEA